MCIAFARRAGSLVGTVGRWGVVAMGFASSRAPTFARISESILDVPSPRPLFELALKCVRRALVPSRISRGPRTAVRVAAARAPSTTGTVTLNPARPASRLTPLPPPPPRDVQESEARILPPVRIRGDGRCMFRALVRPPASLAQTPSPRVERSKAHESAHSPRSGRSRALSIVSRPHQFRPFPTLSTLPRVQ